MSDQTQAVGFLPAVFDRLRELVIDKLGEKFAVRMAKVHDPWYLGADLVRDVEGAATGAEGPANAVVLVPVTPEANDGDMDCHSQAWRQPFQLCFVYARGPDVRTVAEQWAEPLREILADADLRTLGDLHFYQQRTGPHGARREFGRVDRFKVMGPPDYLMPSENDRLYGFGLACFSLRLEVEATIQNDPARRARER